MNSINVSAPRRAYNWALLTLVALLVRSVALGGGGPENVVLVVNADSWASLAVANEYIHLRAIPPANVVYVDGLAEFDSISVDAFRQRILTPVLDTIEQRGLTGQIDYLVYSSDFPYAVNATADYKDVELSPQLRPVGSLTGLTYLYEQVLAQSRDYVQLQTNRYMRRPLPLTAGRALPPEDQQQQQRAIKLITEKEWAEGTKLFAALARKHPRSPRLLYNLACCYAQLQQPARAVATLKRAVKAGWLNYRHAEADEDLRLLRERRDFKQLLERMKNTTIEVQPTQAFRADVGWDEQGAPVASGGRRYLLSTMLGVTSGRGNSVAEVRDCLRRSAAADDARPEGTIYYLVNGDVRSRTRDPMFPSAIAALEKLGVAAESVAGRLPQKRTDVMGLMTGTATFDWPASGSRILPGAICEHLTSAGGVMRDGAGQTPLTEFVRHGAAGASGTVVEPYAIQAKFPFPFIQVHYARGCSLAEAFYQSVAGPYQLLIVGDPLCQPWATTPKVAVAGVKSGASVRGVLELRASVAGGRAQPVDHYELFVDGRRTASRPPGKPFRLDTATLADGYHELRVVAVAADPIQTQGRRILPIMVDNHGHNLKITPPADENVAWDQPLRLAARLKGARRITFLHNERPLATIDGEAGEVEIDPRQLGLGPVQLRAVGEIDGSPAVEVSGAPLGLHVRAAGHLPAIKLDPDQQLADGILLTLPDAKRVVVKDTHEADWLTKAGGEPDQPFELSAYFEVPTNDVYQFQLRSNLKLTVAVDGHTLEQPKTSPWKVLPIALRAGTHELRARGSLNAKPRLDLRFGGPGARRLDPQRFRHVAAAD